MFEINELVITTFKNRWDLNCAGTVEQVNGDGTYDVTVWNIYGPGANTIVRGIPESELKKGRNVTNN